MGHHSRRHHNRRSHHRGYNVHAYSRLLHNILPSLNISNEPIDVAELDGLIQNLLTRYSNVVQPCLDKIKSTYFTNGRICDPDLGAYNIYYVLLELYNWNNDLLKETLIEIGTTCLQGLTHRLLVLYICKKQSDNVGAPDGAPIGAPDSESDGESDNPPNNPLNNAPNNPPNNAPDNPPDNAPDNAPDNPPKID